MNEWWSDWPAWLISLVALGISVYGLRHSKRAAESSEASARHAERSADAAERDIAMREEEAARYDASWEVVRTDKGRYQVFNHTHEARYRVEVSGPVIVTSGVGTVQPGEAFAITDARGFGDVDDPVVTWYRTVDGDGEQYRWRISLV